MIINKNLKFNCPRQGAITEITIKNYNEDLKKILIKVKR